MRRKVNLNKLKKLNALKSEVLGIDKNSIQYLKYRDIAIEFIKQGYNNIRAIYSKFYPKASDYSIDCEAYRLLDNDRFKVALEEAWSIIKIEDLNIAREVILCLRKEMLTAKNSSDRTNAASWLGKYEALFTDKTENRTEIIVRPEEQSELTKFRGSLFPLTN